MTANIYNVWSRWQQMPTPELCRRIIGPLGPGVYQIRNRNTKQLIQFGIGKACQERMKSLFPKPFGKGTRNNKCKRNFILKSWRDLEYRTMPTSSREKAAEIEQELKGQKNHLFNT